LLTPGATAVVTGAAGGLGRRLVAELTARELAVVAVDRVPPAPEVRAALPAARWETVDCSDEERVAALFDRLGPVRLLVNNAGVSRYRPLLDTPAAELRDVLEANLVTAFLCTREAARGMLSAGGGVVVNVVSDVGTRGHVNMAPYVASKHALLGLGRTVALELGRAGVRVLNVLPGPMATDIFGPGTADPADLPPAEVARVVVAALAAAAVSEVSELHVSRVRPPAPG
jgi:NAD(P)-dependent dehydrogenase (short-subunit alcohol dehydrogenase family)